MPDILEKQSLTSRVSFSRHSSEYHLGKHLRENINATNLADKKNVTTPSTRPSSNFPQQPAHKQIESPDSKVIPAALEELDGTTSM